MRILIDGRHLVRPQPSGVGEYTVEILRALFRLDRTNTYVVLTTGRVPMPEGRLGSLPSNVVIRHVPTPNRLLTLRLALTGRPHLDELAGGSFDAAFLPNLAVGQVSPGVPYALTVHDLSWNILPDVYSAKMRLWHRLVKPESLARRAAAVLTPSAHARRDAIRLLRLNPNAVLAVPHGVDARFTAHPQASDHGVRSRLRLPKRFALFVGTLEPRKNVLATIDAIAAYRAATGDDLRLVLAGGWGWNTRALKRRLARPDARAFVQRVGSVAAADLPALYRLASVLVWPSIYEGFGLPVLEAMASGLPVITSHTSSLPELTAGAALLVNPYDPAEITAALTELLGSPALVQRLRAAGLKRAQAFSWDKAAQTLKETLERLGNTSATNRLSTRG